MTAVTAGPNASALALVLGGAGFLGSHLAEALLARGRRVRVFDRENVDLKNLDGMAGDWEFMGGDFTSASDQDRALQGVSAVFHLISTTIPATSNQDPVFDVETNMVATVRLLDRACRERVARVVFVSSGGTVYGRPRRLPITEDHPTEPLVSYGVIKLAVEKYLALYRHLHGLSYRVTRLSNPYGPRQNPTGAQGAASVFLGRVHAGLPIEIWGDGSVVRDYLYVTDAVEGILAAETHTDDEPAVFNIGSGEGTSLNDLVAAIGEVTGREIPVHRLLPRPFDVPANVLDITRARTELGWSPRTSLREGLARTWAWLEGDRRG
jgi:UDP-glucose 4-epimerase